MAMALVGFIMLLMFAAQGSSATRFTFPSSNQTTPIILEHDTYLSLDTILLAKDWLNTSDMTAKFGRASYGNPVQLKDPSTGKMADFSTHFVFSMTRLTKKSYGGDGMAFFIMPFDQTAPNASAGRNLGLFPLGPGLSSSGYTFVAVEFDTFKNYFDPSDQHVGININSIVSDETANWNNGSMNDGGELNAWVTYESASQNLSVFLTHDAGPVFSEKYRILSHQIDLSAHLPDIVRIGFTAATGAQAQTHRVFSWSFNSSLDLVIANQNLTSGVDNVGSGRGNGMKNLVIGLGVLGASITALIICAFVWFRFRRTSTGETEEEEPEMSIDGEFERGFGPKRFTFQELSLATSGFAKSRMLGEGGSGTVYRGILPEYGEEVAVKRISRQSKQGEKEYVSEVKIISRIRHRNLVQLIGWCHKTGEFLLVYEYLPNGSLDLHLFSNEAATVPWRARHGIALGLASAVLYLHQEWEQCVLHRDIKSSNVMLDASFNAKLGDFGLARFVDHEVSLHTDTYGGTVGYIAPEIVDMGKSTKESDVYGFGVVALEICCGRRSIVPDADEPGKVRLVWWVRELYGRGRLLDAVDERLQKEFNVEEVECLMIVGMWCCHFDPNFRPSMKQVMSVLSFETPLPSELLTELTRPMSCVAPLTMSLDSESSSAAMGVSSASTTKTESLSTIADE